MKRLKAKAVEVVVSEPVLTASAFFDSKFFHDLETFESKCDFIAANRLDAELDDVGDKVLTRGLFRRD